MGGGCSGMSEALMGFVPDETTRSRSFGIHDVDIAGSRCFTTLLLGQVHDRYPWKEFVAGR